MKKNITIRLENENDYRNVENLTREAFGMSTVPAAWSTMYCIAIGRTRTLCRSWTLSWS